ncbi:hypothetical protein PAPYR_7291 [Paratrimastix pyriformis]|uniref:Uncharacterized protein n=1 Tax=Paratrimastix pyriformis TaxID=342808 RepID=A0ABQ8UEV1_9EUKA|nr:hypothetical protein PAPYR_7291 [Paratrimastix pyriformis]
MLTPNPIHAGQRPTNATIRPHTKQKKDRPYTLPRSCFSGLVKGISWILRWCSISPYTSFKRCSRTMWCFVFVRTGIAISYDIKNGLITTLTDDAIFFSVIGVGWSLMNVLIHCILNWGRLPLKWVWRLTSVFSEHPLEPIHTSGRALGAAETADPLLLWLWCGVSEADAGAPLAAVHQALSASAPSPRPTSVPAGSWAWRRPALGLGLGLAIAGVLLAFANFTFFPVVTTLDDPGMIFRKLSGPFVGPGWTVTTTLSTLAGTATWILSMIGYVFVCMVHVLALGRLRALLPTLIRLRPLLAQRQAATASATTGGGPNVVAPGLARTAANPGGLAGGSNTFVYPSLTSYAQPEECDLSVEVRLVVDCVQGMAARTEYLNQVFRGYLVVAIAFNFALVVAIVLHLVFLTTAWVLIYAVDIFWMAVCLIQLLLLCVVSALVRTRWDGLLATLSGLPLARQADRTAIQLLVQHFALQPPAVAIAGAVPITFPLLVQVRAATTCRGVGVCGGWDGEMTPPLLHPPTEQVFSLLGSAAVVVRNMRNMIPAVPFDQNVTNITTAVASMGKAAFTSLTEIGGAP